MSDISENARVRLLGGRAPGEKPPTPLPPRPSPQPASPPDPVPPQTPVEPIFLADSADGADVLDAAQVVRPLAQLCMTSQVQTPFLAAIAGPGGAGKTFALRRLAQMIVGTNRSPARPGSGEIARVVVARVDAAGGVEAPVALASAAYAALDRDAGGADYSALLDESAHAGGDPLRAAKAASERHEEIVRKLEAERSQSDDIEARRARLGDSLLYDTPGSRIDVFVRAYRGTIEARLRRFDLAGPDPVVSFRDLVRDLTSLGAGARAAVVLRAIWAYGSQRRLLVWAIVAFALAFGLGWLHRDATAASIANFNASLKPGADWIAEHGDWFKKASDILLALGALALALNLWRAFGFSSLLFRGARLLNIDVRDRRRDLDARAAQLNQRVAALSVEAEAAARNVEAATRRAGGKAATRAPGPDFLDAGHGPSADARAFLASLSERIGRAQSAGAAPDRLVFVVDNLDALAPEAAIGWIGAAQSVIGPGMIGLLALDPARLVDALGGPQQARRRFDKWLQIIVNLPGRFGVGGDRLVARLLSTAGHTAPPQVDSNVATALVEPLSSAEAALLTALAPLAARSPRDAKRFLNAYRLARCSDLPRPVVALMQAVAFGDDEARAAMDDLLLSGSRDLGDVQGPETLANAIRTARAANSGAISLEDARSAAETARRYTLAL